MPSSQEELLGHGKSGVDRLHPVLACQDGGHRVGARGIEKGIALGLGHRLFVEQRQGVGHAGGVAPGNGPGWGARHDEQQQRDPRAGGVRETNWLDRVPGQEGAPQKEVPER